MRIPIWHLQQKPTRVSFFVVNAIRACPYGTGIVKNDTQVVFFFLLWLAMVMFICTCPTKKRHACRFFVVHTHSFTQDTSYSKKRHACRFLFVQEVHICMLIWHSCQKNDTRVVFFSQKVPYGHAHMALSEKKRHACRFFLRSARMVCLYEG